MEDEERRGEEEEEEVKATIVCLDSGRAERPFWTSTLYCTLK